MRQQFWLAVILISITVCYAQSENSHIFKTQDQQWQQRAYTTADRPKAARRLILQAIYARETVPVLVGYQQALREKPKSEARIANTAHAHWAANLYYRPNEKNIINSGTDYDLIYRSLAHLVQPGPALTADTSPSAQHEEGSDQISVSQFKPTNLADAWYAWGRLQGDCPAQERAYEHALTLDPTFAQAYYARACMSKYVLSNAGRTGTSWYPDPQRALRDLNKAEQLEPQLHILCLAQRSRIEGSLGMRKEADADWEQYLRLWPEMPDAKRYQKYWQDYLKSYHQGKT